jgi:hypothetical protein
MCRFCETYGADNKFGCINEKQPSAASTGSRTTWTLKCDLCGSEVEWQAATFFDAADTLPSGWTHERGVGTVCPNCKI